MVFMEIFVTVYKLSLSANLWLKKCHFAGKLLDQFVKTTIVFHCKRFAFETKCVFNLSIAIRLGILMVVQFVSVMSFCLYDLIT